VRLRNSIVLWVLLGAASPAAAQHEHAPMHEHAAHEAGLLGVPPTREGSGTAWQPDSSPMYGWHVPLGAGWSVMLHGNLFAGLDAQGSDRGATEAFSVNWAMAMLHGRAGPGELRLRAMLSAEPWTVANGGYPLLLQTGETFEGRPLHDRQHPHDLFMELSAQYALALAGDFGVSLYAGLPGEPALGPPAYPHRFSALFNPAAPIGHHWQDATHIAFGVLTLGAFTEAVRFEGSVFNGREPDEHRTDIETAPLDSFSARLQLALAADWSAQISSGRLRDPEQLHPGEDVTRSTASITWNRPGGDGANGATTAVWGANHLHGRTTHGGLLEDTEVLPGERLVLFGRAELIGKGAEELALPLPADEVFTLFGLTLGGIVEFPEVGFLVPGIGASGTISAIPEGLRPFYGTRVPVGAFLFVHVRPPSMRMRQVGQAGSTTPVRAARRASHTRKSHMPASIEPTKSSRWLAPAPIDAKAGPGHQPPRPQPMPKSAAPAIRRASGFAFGNAGNDPPSTGAPRFRMSRRATA